MKKYTALLLSLFSSMILFSQDFSGSWNGELNFQAMKLKVVYHLNKDNNVWTGKMDSPDQGAKNIPIEKVKVKSDSIFITDSRIMMLFKGKMIDNEIKGVFKQGNFSTNLNLSKGDVKAPNRPQTPIAPFDYKTEELTIVNTIDDVTLAGTLTIPKKGKKHPLVILISGSGAQDRDETIFSHKPFAVIADYLTKNGYAVFRFDDRGTAKSTGTFIDATTFNFANDVDAMVNHLATRKDFKNKKIGLIGHSEGGIVAGIVASKNPKVSFVVSLAGTGVTGKDVLIEQNYLIGKASNLPEPILQKNKKTNENLYNFIIDEDWKDFNYSAERVVRKFKLFQPELNSIENQDLIEQLIPKNTNWFATFLKLNPAEYYTKISIPVLALNGEKDVQVFSIQNLPALKATFKNKKSNTISYPNLNHMFQTAKTGNVTEYNVIEETFSPLVLHDILVWLNKL